MPEGLDFWRQTQRKLAREVSLGTAITMGGVGYGQTPTGGINVGFLGQGYSLGGQGDDLIQRVASTPTEISTMTGGKMGMGVAAFATGTTLISAGIGFSQHGLLGAAGMLGTDLAVSAASTRALPKIINAAGKVTYATNMGAQIGSFAGPVIGSIVGGMGGSLLGPAGMYTGQMAGAYAGGILQGQGLMAGGATIGRSVMSGMGTGLRVAARHPLAAFTVAAGAAALTAGYATYKSAQIGMGALAAGARFRRNQRQINTAGDLAAFNTRRSATAAQMAHRHRQALGMQLSEAYSMTATRYHHAQRVFR